MLAAVTELPVRGMVSGSMWLLERDQVVLGNWISLRYASVELASCTVSRGPSVCPLPLA